MAKTGISARSVIRITLLVILIILTIFANFIVIRRGAHYVIEVNFYGRLSAAYDIGGRKGLEIELAKIKAGSGGKQEIVLAAEFQKKLGGINDPEGFIDRALAEDKRMIKYLQGLRTYAFALILVVLIARIFINLKLRGKQPGL